MQVSICYHHHDHVRKTNLKAENVVTGENIM